VSSVRRITYYSVDSGATAESRYIRQAVSESRMFLAQREKAHGGLTCKFDTALPRRRVDYVLVTLAGTRLSTMSCVQQVLRLWGDTRNAYRFSV